MKKFITSFLFIMLILGQPLSVWAALPPGFETETLASGLNLPTTIAFTPDGRIFIAEKDGTIKVFKNGALLATPLVQLTDVNAYGDRGLIGLAVDPNFTTNGFIYVLYTYENTPGANFGGPKTGRIARLTVVGDVADESSKVVLVGSVGGTLAAPSCENYPATADCIASDTSSHSVGGLRFGPDGKLYASLGDGSHFDYVDTRALRAQNIDALAGKILRINTDGTAPSDNPFFNGSTTANRSKVFAYGTRNDFRFSFRPSNGALYGGDVGWSSFEEVNKIVSGGNYGWPCREGMGATVGYNCTAVNAIDPIYTYAHDGNGAGSITGGAFPTAYPTEYNNSYFFGDYAQNWIKRLIVDANDNFIGIQDFMGAADGSNGPVEMITGPDGNIYYLAIYTGELKRILYTTGNRQPIAVISASPTNGLAPLTVNFSSAGSSDPDGNPIAYTWNFGDGSGVSNLANPSHTYTSNGSYLATLKVTDGLGGQNIKSVNISVGNQAPTAQIVAPVTGSLYRVGDVVQLQGVATDPEQGTLAPSALSWKLILHHNVHTHQMETLTGTNPSFIYPDHQATDIYLEVQLTATDAGGLTNTKSINLYLNNNQSSGGNLIANPSLEDGVPGSPNNWSKGGYGINDTIYTYPVIGFEGVNAAKMQMNSYSSGDAKWSHDPVTVQPGKQYAFSGYYQSNVNLGTVVQVGIGGGQYTYIDLGDADAQAGWTRIDRIFTAPAGAQTAVVMQTLNGVGVVTIDNYSLTEIQASTDTTPPQVSIASPLGGQTISGTTTIVANATDNVGVTNVEFRVNNTVVGNKSVAPFNLAWNTKSVANGAYPITVVARDAAGNIATSTLASVTVLNATGGGVGGANLVPNPSVEVLGAASGTPQSWLKGKFGTNGATFIYPSTPFDGIRGLKLSMPSYTSGDAKWYVQEVNVTPGTQYNFSHYYQADVTTTLQLRYTSTANVLSYQTLAANLPIAATWTKTNYNFTPPVGTKSVTVFHILKKIGNLSTDLYNISTVSGGSPDTTQPVVSISTPANSSTVSGTVTLRAQAADAASGVAGVKFFVDGTQRGGEDVLSPYEYDLDTTVLSNGAHTLIAVARDVAGNSATSSVVNFTSDNGVINPGDTLAPTINWLTPANGATTTGMVSLTVNATDNVGVVAVDYTLDGAPLFTTTVSPFSFNWNSASTSNGVHTLGATARDAAGNQAAQNRLVVVSNTSGTTTPPLGPNLIVNGNFETANGASPFAWNQGGWGTNNRAFTYPVTGHDGNKAARVAMTTYTSGDAKWYPNKFNVSPGTQYSFSGWYKTGTILDVIGEYTMSDGSFLYVGISKENQPTTTWTKVESTFTPPVGATSLTLYPLISAIGTLDIDDFSVNAMGSTTINMDVRAPLVAMTAPAEGATVSGVVNITASSTDNVAVTKLWFAVDGNVVSPVYATAPYVFALNTTALTNGVHVLKATAEDAVGNNAAATSTIIVNNVAGGDTTKPTVAITAPTNAATVSGVVSITASSSDNVAVAGVKFLVDGVQQGAEDTVAPYSVAWNSASTTNGAHTLSAVARDSSNNSTTSTISVTVSNSVVTPGNLILNPSVENGTTIPTNWAQGGWGTNNRVLSYPVTGQDGAKAMKIDITTYTDGDAKWYFDPVAVTPGTLYTFTDQYKSNVVTTVTARYTLSSGAFSYVVLGTALPQANWTQYSTTFTPPVGATHVTIFHALQGVGSLTTDNYSLAPATGSTYFDQGMVSLTFDDGWMSHYDTVLPILNTAGLKGTFGIISLATIESTPSNAVTNPSMETANGASPSGWNQGGWGTNNAVFTYPVTGHIGTKASKIDITSYTSGDAKWYANDVSVIDSGVYDISLWYMSNVTTDVLVRFSSGTTTSYQFLGNATPSATWKQFTAQVTVPADTTSMTVFHTLNSVGSLTTDDLSITRRTGATPTYVNAAQVLAMQAAGMEIASHTRTHASLSTVPVATMQTEVLGSRNELLGIGATPVTSIIYPYGDYNPQVESYVQSVGYLGGRSVDRGYNTRLTDKYALKIQQIDLTTTVPQIQAWINTAVADKTWLILMFHQVDTAGTELSITPTNFQQVVDYLKNQNVPVVTMQQGLSQM